MREIKIREFEDGKLLYRTVAYKAQQYTGVKDKNGVEIYEGDIVKFEYIHVPWRDYISSYTNQEVFYSDEEAQFLLGRDLGFSLSEVHDLEVVK